MYKISLQVSKKTPKNHYLCELRRYERLGFKGEEGDMLFTVDTTLISFATRIYYLKVILNWK